jgi:hypothetical protein
MDINVIFDGPVLASSPRNLTQAFKGGQFIYCDPHLPPDPNTGGPQSLILGVAFLIKVPLIGGEKLVLWDSLQDLDSKVLTPIPREVSESGYEIYLGIGTSIDQPNFTVYVIYSDVTQESLASQLDTLQDDLNLILQNQTTPFTLESALAANALAQNTALTILGTGLAPISAGVTAGVVPVLAGSQLLLLLPG